MKPAKFDYFAPATLDEALELLARHGPDAKALAGGQSLMPMMNLRLVRPAVVIDINRIQGLSGISVADGTVTVGALTRQRELERSGVIRSAFPMMTAAISHIGHFQIRNPRHHRGQPGPRRPRRRAARVVRRARCRIRGGRQQWDADEFQPPTSPSRR